MFMQNNNIRRVKNPTLTPPNKRKETSFQLQIHGNRYAKLLLRPPTPNEILCWREGIILLEGLTGTLGSRLLWEPTTRLRWVGPPPPPTLLGAERRKGKVIEFSAIGNSKIISGSDFILSDFRGCLISRYPPLKYLIYAFIGDGG